jgi:hypothetical protein
MSEFREKVGGFFRSVHDTWVEDILRLKIYGDSLLTPRVEAEMSRFGVILALQFLVDLFVWRWAWSYALADAFLVPTLFGIVFAGAVLMYDVSIIVMDTGSEEPNSGFLIPILEWRVLKSTQRQLLMRFAILLGLAFVTAIPAELKTFEDEINNRIERVEKHAIDVIRKDAVDKEQAQLTEDDAHATTQRTADVEKHRLELQRKRTQLLEAQQSRRAGLQKARDDAAQRAADEVSGNYKSRAPGAGVIYKALLEEKRQAEAELASFETTAAKELSDFDAHSAQEIADHEKGRDTDADARLATSREKVKEIQRMDPDRLVKLYGGSWKQPRGFLYRFKSLQALADEDQTVRIMIWGLRAVLVVLGIFVLALKLMASQELKRYFSLAAQAGAGNLQAQRIVGNMGFGNFAQFALSDKVRSQLSEYNDAVINLAGAIADFREAIRAEAQKDGVVTGKRQDRQTIIGALHAVWMTSCQPKINELNRLEARLTEAGINIPSWPSKLLDGTDPRTIQPELWQVSMVDLIQNYGWEDPQAKQREEGAMRVRMVEIRNRLRAGIEKLRSILDVAVRMQDVRHPQILTRLHGAWETNVAPVLSDLNELEWQMTEAGMAIPEWPRDFPDPRPTLESEWHTPTPNNLLARGYSMDYSYTPPKVRSLRPDAKGAAQSASA